MTIYQVFPFEYVKQNSRVIIYGLGRYGKSYIEQIQATKWCEIVGVSDSDASKRLDDLPFYEMGKLKELEFDYIIIAMLSTEMTNLVYKELLEKEISDLKIISALERTGKDYKYSVVKEKRDGAIKILLQSFGGLGDCVVNLSVYEKIVSMLEMAEIDIQCRKAYGEAVFTSKRWIRSILGEKDKVDVAIYDLILKLDHGIRVIWFDEERCHRLSPAFSQKIKELIATSDDFEKKVMEHQYCVALQLRRASIRGWNRFRTLGHGEVLDLKSDMVKVDLDRKHILEYQDFQLEKYITINYGAYWIDRYNKIQIKVWPLSYFEKLVQMLKRQYPEYEIIQLGDTNTEHIKGVNRYIKGQNLELVKHILSNAILHIDSEGGLVHLATALGTKCVVVFGPTPVEYYGYPQNINVVSEKCHNCMGLIVEWYVKCLRGEERPECMYGISPEMVFEQIKGYLAERI